MSSAGILAVLIAAIVAVNARDLGVCHKSSLVSVGINDVSSFTNQAPTDPLSGENIYHPAWLAFYAPMDAAYDFEVLNWSIDNGTRMALYSSRFPRGCNTPKIEGYNDDIGSKWWGPFAKRDDAATEDDEAAPEDYASEGEDTESFAAISIGDDNQVINEFGNNYNKLSRFVVPLTKGHYKIALGNEKNGNLGGYGELKITVKPGWCNNQINTASKGNNDVDTKVSQGYSENGIHKSVWFKFTAPQDDVYNFETTSWSSRSDSQLAIYENSCNKDQYSAPTEIDSNDNQKWNNKLSFVRHFMNEGDIVYIQVGNAHRWQRHATGNLKISRSPGWCESTPNQYTTVFAGAVSNNVSAKWSEADDITYDNIKIDEPVWLTFEVTQPGAYKFEVENWEVDDDDDNDSAMAVFSLPERGEWPDACPLGDDDNMKLEKIHDDIVPGFLGINRRSRIVLELVAGTYKIAIGNGDRGIAREAEQEKSNVEARFPFGYRKGEGKLSIKLLPGWCDAQILTATVGMNAVDASASWHTLRSQSDIHRGVWYKFTAPATAKYIFEVTSWSNGDSEIALYEDGSCPNPNQLYINDDIRSRAVNVNDEVAEFTDVAVANQKAERAWYDVLINALNVKNKLSRAEYDMATGDVIDIYVGNADDDDTFATGTFEIHQAKGRCDTPIDGSIDTNIAIDATRADTHSFTVNGEKIYNGVWVKFTAFESAYYEFDVSKWNQPKLGNLNFYWSRAALLKTSCDLNQGTVLKTDFTVGLSNIKYWIEMGETVYFIVGNPYNFFNQETNGVVRITRHWGECDDTSIQTANTWDNAVNGTIASGPDVSGNGSPTYKVYEPIWFKFKAPEAGTWVFDVTSWEAANDNKRGDSLGEYSVLPKNNAAIAVKGSTCGSSWKGSNDNRNNLNNLPRLDLKLNKNDIVRIAVGNGVNGRLHGSGNLRIYLAGGICEDPFKAKEGFPYNDVFTANTSGVAKDGIHNPVWFEFKAPRYGTYTLEVTSWDNNMKVLDEDSQLGAYRGSCNSLTQLADNDDISFLNKRSKAEVTLNKDQKIFIVVGNAAANYPKGHGTLAITHRPGRCNTRYFIDAGKFHDVNATETEAPEKRLSGFDYIWKPVYFRFRPKESARFVIDVESWNNQGDNDAEVAIWSMDDDDDGCQLPSNRIVATDDDYADTNLPLISTWLQKNKRYTIAIGNAKPLQKAGTGRFALSAHGHCRNADRLQFWGTNTVIAWDTAAENITLPEAFDNLPMYTPVWTEFKSRRTGRYMFAVTYWDDGGNDGDDTVMAAMKGPCRSPTIIAVNDDSNHTSAESLKSRVEISMQANDEIKIVVGSWEPTRRGWGKIKITYRKEPAQFKMVVPDSLDYEEIEAAINKALGFDDDEDSINFVNKPQGPTKRSVKDLYHQDSVEPGYQLIYIEAAEGHDDDMDELTVILNEGSTNANFKKIGYNFSPMFCVANCAGKDFDDDSVDDAVDVCPGVKDPAQRDSDGNGVGDLCQCSFLLAAVDVDSIEKQGHIQTCDMLTEQNTKYFYHGHKKIAGDWVRNYVRNIGAVTFQPGDYTYNNKWLDCDCDTFPIDIDHSITPFGPGFVPQVDTQADIEASQEWDSEIVASDGEPRPLEPAPEA